MNDHQKDVVYRELRTAKMRHESIRQDRERTWSELCLFEKAMIDSAAYIEKLEEDLEGYVPPPEGTFRSILP